MSKKLFALVSTCVTAAGTVGSAIVAYAQPTMYGAVIAAIGIAVAAINDILLLFVKQE